MCCRSGGAMAGRRERCNGLCPALALSEGTVTTKRVKQVLLGLLLAVAGYIWWGNLALLFPSTVPVEEHVPLDTLGNSQTATSIVVAYREPKVNPFLHAVAAPHNQQREHAPAPSGPVPLPATLHLVGVLCFGESSQAVLQVDPQTTRTFTLGERLGEWTLIEVTDATAVFNAGKARDTLHLVGRLPVEQQ